MSHEAGCKTLLYPICNCEGLVKLHRGNRTVSGLKIFNFESIVINLNVRRELPYELK